MTQEHYRRQSGVGLGFRWVLPTLTTTTFITLRAKLSGAVYCYRSCLWRAGGWRVFVGVCLWVCYHDNSKLHASIFTKPGLQVKVVTISSWLNFGRPAPPGRGLQRGEKFWLRLTTANAQCLRLYERVFHCNMSQPQGWIKTTKTHRRDRLQYTAPLSIECNNRVCSQTSESCRQNLRPM